MDNVDSAHALLDHEGRQNYHAQTDFQALLPTIDSSLSGEPNINKMQVSASYIHQIAGYQDEQSLQLLACKTLSDKIKKWENKQRKEATPRSHPEKDSEKEHNNTPADTSVGRQETKAAENLKKEAEDYYKKEHPDVTVQKTTLSLVDRKERLIKGKPQYLLKHNDSAAAPDGLLHIVVVKSIEPELGENDEKYHQIQALLYAGGLKYCDYVQCSKTGDAAVPTILHILPNVYWQKTAVPNAEKYCRYFDKMWGQVLLQHRRK